MRGKLKFFLIGAAVIIGIDLVFINWFVLQAKDKTSTAQITSFSTPSCPSGCLQKIKEATAGMQLISQQVDTDESLVQPQTSVEQVIVSQSSAKEFFVPIGSGSTTSKDWTTLSGLEAQVNSANYASVSQAFFEASLRIPTGNGRLEARLINLSDNVPLAETEVYVEGTNGKLVTRQFALRSGNKLYGVQIRSTMGFLGILDLARIKIVTN